MAITVQTLLTEKSRKFGAPQSSVEFRQIFLDAVNDTLDDINQMLNVTTADANGNYPITSVDAQIDLDAQTFNGTVSLGVDWYISAHGEYALKDTDRLEAQYRRKMNMLMMNYFKDNDTAGGKLGDVG